MCRELIKSDMKYYNNMERSYTSDMSISNIKFTEREQDCVFYLLRGYTMKMTSKALNISPRTVESHLEQIKYKIKVKNKAAIIEYFLAQGMLSYIPRNIISKNISSIIYPDN